MMTNAYSLTLRESPNGNSAALGYIPYGAYVHWTGISEDVGGVTWYKVKYQLNGEQLSGWVSKTFLTPFIAGTSLFLFETQVEKVFEDHNVSLEGNWNLRDQRAAAVAIDAVAKALARESGISEHAAFEIVFTQVTLVWGTESNAGRLTNQCRHITGGGCTSSVHLINFMSLWSPGPYRSEEVAFQASVNNIVHEFGHAFANPWWTVDSDTGTVEYSEDGPYHQLSLLRQRELLTNEGFYEADTEAYKVWRQHYEESPTPNEVFADMFLGWVCGIKIKRVIEKTVIWKLKCQHG